MNNLVICVSLFFFTDGKEKDENPFVYGKFKKKKKSSVFCEHWPSSAHIETVSTHKSLFAINATLITFLSPAHMSLLCHQLLLQTMRACGLGGWHWPWCCSH